MVPIHVYVFWNWMLESVRGFDSEAMSRTSNTDWETRGQNDNEVDEEGAQDNRNKCFVRIEAKRERS